jgi:hypothetical protein
MEDNDCRQPARDGFDECFALLATNAELHTAFGINRHKNIPTETFFERAACVQ